MSNRLFRLLQALGITVLLLLGLAFVVSAQGEGNQPPQPKSIAFMEKGKLTVDRKWLEGHVDSVEDPQKALLPINIRNNSTLTQTVALTLEEFVRPLSTTDSNLEGLVGEPDPLDLAPGKPGEFVLTFDLDALGVFTKSASYPGVLVATSFPGGSVIHRDFELKVEDRQDPTPMPTPSPLNAFVSQLWKPPQTQLASEPSTVTVRGTNYLPSLLSPVHAALLWIGVAVLLLRWGAKKLELKLEWGKLKLDFTANGLQGTLIILGTILAVLGAVLFLVPLITGADSWQPALVYVRPVSVPPGATLGPVAGADGSLGVLERGEDGLLQVHGIPRAGEYEGKIDLQPSTDKGDVTVKVQIADWWPFAFLTILLGVAVGYLITKWYKQKRGPEEQRVRAAKLWQEIAQAESDFQRDNSGRPQRVYTMANLAEKWIREAEDVLDHSPALLETVKTDLTALEAYHDGFRALWERLKDLDGVYARVKEQANPTSWGVGQDEVDAFKAADNILNGVSYVPFEIPDNEDKKGTSRDACKAEVVAALKWLPTLEESYRRIEGWVLEAQRILGLLNPDSQDAKDLKEYLKELKKQLRIVLRADKEEVIGVAQGAADDSWDKIRKLAQKRKLDLAEPAWALEEREVEPSEITVKPVYTGALPQGYHGDPDTLFGFTVSVDLPGQEAYKLQWDFDGARSELWIEEGPAQSVKLKAYHRFSTSGKHPVRLLVNGQCVTQCEVLSIAPQGRWLKLRESFKLTDQQMAVVTGLLAVASGFLATYLSNAVWGSPKDYLQAFLWGAITSEGLKVVANLANKIWPP